jgi:predicted outer membrane lipoprotein
MAINLKQRSPFLELLGIIIAAIFGVILANSIELFEIVYQWSRAHEEWQVDEVFTTFIVLTIGLSIFSVRRWREQVREHIDLMQLMVEQKKMIV